MDVKLFRGGIGDMLRNYIVAHLPPRIVGFKVENRILIAIVDLPYDGVSV